jgi:hypothetical protein
LSPIDFRNILHNLCKPHLHTPIDILQRQMRTNMDDLCGKLRARADAIAIFDPIVCIVFQCSREHLANRPAVANLAERGLMANEKLCRNVCVEGRALGEQGRDTT